MYSGLFLFSRWFKAGNTNIISYAICIFNPFPYFFEKVRKGNSHVIFRLFLSISNKVTYIISSITAMIYIQNMLEIKCILAAFSWFLCWIFPFPAGKALQFIRICEINMGTKVTMWFNEFPKVSFFYLCSKMQLITFQNFQIKLVLANFFRFSA